MTATTTAGTVVLVVLSFLAGMLFGYAVGLFLGYHRGKHTIVAETPGNDPRRGQP